MAPPSTAALASNSGPSAGQQAGGSGVPSKSETGLHACPQAHKKPSISKVILKVMADKGARNRVSLATLKKALVTTGYNMARNDWRFKKVLKGLVEKGLLRQVTSKGAAGSFRMGKKHASGFQRAASRRGRPRRGRQLGKPRLGQRRLLLGSKQGPKQLMKAARRVAKCPRI
uniref:H15 domain-containing protein n=2 Tax=Pipistrellus kuhlii TaxID=59472 RepID=A0A7J7U8A1_PIPKU|nr:hypothetical protein mPipKuh1_006198 [Pipistrellus kuhlii]